MQPDIKVIDSIMGSGKTTWSINYMNAHPDERFIYVTPFLDECERIKEACPHLDFIAPDDTFSKQYEFRRLISDGRNIAITHKLLSVIRLNDNDKRMLDYYAYTFIIDEAVETVVPVNDVSRADTRILLRSNSIEIDDHGYVKWIDEEEEKEGTKKFAEIKKMANAGTLICFRESLFMWILPLDTFMAMKNVVVMTYLFDASHLKHYFDSYDLSYERYYIDHGELKLGMQNLSSHKKKLRELIHIYDGKLNSFADDKTALSATKWKSTKMEDNVMKKVAMNNTRNFFMHINQASAHDCMWSSFKNDKYQVKDYASCFVPFNSKAVNNYGDRTCLAYLVNIFEHPMISGWFADRKTELDEEVTALSTMLQWIWRSAIRNGKPIQLYLPSKRMRKILVDWLMSA